jgi:FkbM family methyltransferase
MNMADVFEPYVAKSRYCGSHVFDFHIADDIGKSWYDGSPNQNMPERQWCLDHVGRGFTVLDCGAHHGMMTVLFSLMTGPTGRVLAWDALPENAEIVRLNAALNGCTNVTVHPRALGARRQIVHYDRNFGNVNVLHAGSDRPASGTIEVVALDEDLEIGLHVDFVKLDVEGSELDALKGMATVLVQRPLIDLEIHNFLYPDRVKTLDAIFTILDRQHYSYDVLPEPSDAITRIGPQMDRAWLAQHYNPHVFCTPL